MNAYADRTHEGKSAAERRNEAGLHARDIRPGATAQNGLQMVADKSQQVAQMRKVQSLADSRVTGNASGVIQRVLHKDKSTTKGYPLYDDFIMQDVKIIDILYRAPKVDGKTKLERTIEERQPVYILEDAVYFMKWAHIPEEDDTMPLDTYTERESTREWKTWSNKKWNEEKDAKGTSKVIPPSTAKIPSTLVSVTQTIYLPSISVEGLNVYYAGKGGLGSAHGDYKYAPRDMYLDMIWLGTSGDVGKSMQGSLKDSELTEIIIKVPNSFKMAYMRMSSAVMDDDPNAESTTILCFESIPSEYLFIKNKEGKEVCLKSELGKEQYLKERERDKRIFEDSKRPVDKEERKESIKEKDEKVIKLTFDLSKFNQFDKDSGKKDEEGDDW